MDEGSYNFKFLNSKNGRYETWTGFFNDEEQAQRWWSMWGSFHESRGHFLTLFYKGNIINPEWMKPGSNLIEETINKRKNTNIGAIILS
jgi:hypothetical protein